MFVVEDKASGTSPEPSYERTMSSFFFSSYESWKSGHKILSQLQILDEARMLSHMTEFTCGFLRLTSALRT